MVYINIVDSVRPVLLCKKNRDLFVDFFMNSKR